MKNITKWKNRFQAYFSSKRARLNIWFTQIKKRTGNAFRIKLLQSRLFISNFTRRLWNWISVAVVSFFGCSIASSILFTPQLRSATDNFQPLEAILSQLGATYGTILALVLTLSIIPIQRAGEVWSPSIIRLYRENPATYVTFVALSIFCLTSFLFAVRGLAGMPVSMVLAFSFAILSITFDILRWYQRHMCQLLEPTHAVGLVLSRVKQVIDETKMRVMQIARLQYQLCNSNKQGQLSQKDIETIVYTQIDGYPDSINLWISDLAEIAIKAVVRGEKILAKAAISATADLTVYFLSSRKHNLMLFPAQDSIVMATSSDVDIITYRSFETLSEISRVAVTQGDESTAILVSWAYQRIAIHTANLQASAFNENTAPLTFTPIHYAFSCVKYAQTKELDEVVFQTAFILSRIPIEVHKDIHEIDIHIPVIDGLINISMYFYGRRNQAIAEKINGYQCSILAHMFQQKDYYFKDTFRYVLEKMQILVPLAILNETMTSPLSMTYPLVEVYGQTNPTSISYIFDRAATTLPKLDADREWLNPYSDLIEIIDIVSNHLRRIAEDTEFGESFLIWGINSFIKHMAVAITRVIDHPLRKDRGDEDELIDKFLWVLSFYWVAFNSKKNISKRRAIECCDSLVFIGLIFFERNHLKVLNDNITNIRTILDSYCEIAQSPDYYAIGDILAHLWGIRMVLVASKNDTLTQKVDRALGTKPTALTDEQWQSAQNAILRRRDQLEESLKETTSRLDRDSTEALLRRLLRED